VTWRSFELDPHAPRERAVDSTTLARGGNTFDAHRLVHLGDSHGLQDAIKERLMRAYFTEGERIGDSDVLVSDRYVAEVRGDESTAMSLGISAVPFFVVRPATSTAAEPLRR
jgi:predicted DsbA family dithiol-disulfide isomerase